MIWSIRQANLADAKALSLVGGATFLETFAAVHTGAELVAHCEAEHSVLAYKRILGPDTDVWLTEIADTGAPMGYAILSLPRLPGHRRGDLELKRIYLMSRLHGSGVGVALMDRVLARAQERGAERLVLGVYSANTRAIAFYRKAGFERIGEYQFFVGKTGYEDWILARTF